MKERTVHTILDIEQKTGQYILSLCVIIGSESKENLCMVVVNDPGQ